VFSVVTDVITTFIKFIAGTVNDGIGMLVDLLGGALDGVGNLASGIVNKLDVFSGFTDAISGANDGLMEFLGLSEEVDRVSRGPAAFTTLEEAAARTGTTVDNYLDVRSAALAGEQTARDKGLSKDIIRDRLKNGEGVFTDVSPAEMKKYGVSGVDAQRDGQVEAGSANVDAMRTAVASGMQDAEKSRRDKKGKRPIVNVVVGGEIVPGIMALAGELAAFDFGGDVLGTGT